MLRRILPNRELSHTIPYIFNDVKNPLHQENAVWLLALWCCERSEVSSIIFLYQTRRYIDTSLPFFWVETDFVSSVTRSYAESTSYLSQHRALLSACHRYGTSTYHTVPYHDMKHTYKLIDAKGKRYQILKTSRRLLSIVGVRMLLQIASNIILT